MPCHGKHPKTRVERTTFFVGAERVPVPVERHVCLLCQTVFAPEETRRANQRRLHAALKRATPSPGPLVVFRDELDAHLAARTSTHT